MLIQMKRRAVVVRREVMWRMDSPSCVDMVSWFFLLLCVVLDLLTFGWLFGGWVDEVIVKAFFSSGLVVGAVCHGSAK